MSDTRICVYISYQLNILLEGSNVLVRNLTTEYTGFLYDNIILQVELDFGKISFVFVCYEFKEK